VEDVRRLGFVLDEMHTPLFIYVECSRGARHAWHRHYSLVAVRGGRLAGEVSPLTWPRLPKRRIGASTGAPAWVAARQVRRNVRETQANTRRDREAPRRRKLDAYLSRICVSVASSVTMRQAAGPGPIRFFQSRGCKRSLSLRLGHPVGDAPILG
jgi:hypothetical protein